MGGRKLSAEGRRYKRETTSIIARNHFTDLAKVTKNVPYRLVIEIGLPRSQLLCKGYPKTTRNRYKRIDALNRAKLVEDALSDALGIDDSHNWSVTIKKVVSDTASTRIRLWEMPDGEDAP
jgi:Holliday junction resolvase RusA-like endonuclease